MLQLIVSKGFFPGGSSAAYLIEDIHRTIRLRFCLIRAYNELIVLSSMKLVLNQLFFSNIDRQMKIDMK